MFYPLCLDDKGPLTLYPSVERVERKKGSNFSVICTTEGMRYYSNKLQWFRENGNLPNTTKIVRQSVFVRLDFSSLKVNDTGIYKCNITDNTNLHAKRFQLIVFGKWFDYFWQNYKPLVFLNAELAMFNWERLCWKNSLPVFLYKNTWFRNGFWKLDSLSLITAIDIATSTFLHHKIKQQPALKRKFTETNIAKNVISHMSVLNLFEAAFFEFRVCFCCFLSFFVLNFSLRFLFFFPRKPCMKGQTNSINNVIYLLHLVGPMLIIQLWYFP